MPNLATSQNSPVLTVFHCPDETPEPAGTPAMQSPVPASFVEAFAAATGWVIDFEESAASCRRRLAVESALPTDGTLTIVDMSSTWPARTPTCHRAKCDQFVAELNGLVRPTLIANQRELANGQTRFSAGTLFSEDV